MFVCVCVGGGVYCFDVVLPSVLPSAIHQISKSMKLNEYVDLRKIKIHVFHRFLIWPLTAGLCPLEVLIRKSSLSLLLLDRLKDFLEIKYVNLY